MPYSVHDASSSCDPTACRRHFLRLFCASFCAAEYLGSQPLHCAGNSFGDVTPFPFIFTDSGITGIQGNILLDHYIANPGLPLIGTLPLTGITTSFSSKSKGALMLSINGQYLAYMGYTGPVGANGVFSGGA